MANYYSQKKKKNQTTLLEAIIVGILKGFWALIKLPFGKKTQGISTDDRKEILSRRLAVENMIVDDLNVLKQAVFEADKLVDYTLQAMGYQGETFAERLRSAERNISPGLYDRIWQGHKVRNQLAHEHNFSASPAQLKQAIINLLEYIKSI